MSNGLGQRNSAPSAPRTSLPPGAPVCLALASTAPFAPRSLRLRHHNFEKSENPQQEHHNFAPARLAALKNFTAAAKNAFPGKISKETVKFYGYYHLAQTPFAAPSPPFLAQNFTAQPPFFTLPGKETVKFSQGFSHAAPTPPLDSKFKVLPRRLVAPKRSDGGRLYADGLAAPEALRRRVDVRLFYERKLAPIRG